MLYLSFVNSFPVAERYDAGLKVGEGPGFSSKSFCKHFVKLLTIEHLALN